MVSYNVAVDVIDRREGGGHFYFRKLWWNVQIFVNESDKLFSFIYLYWN